MSITASYVALAIIAIRLFLKRVPKIFSYILWLPVLIRLVIPFSFSSKISLFSFLRAKAKTSSGIIEYVQNNIGNVQNPVIDAGTNTVNNVIDKPVSAISTTGVSSIQTIMELAGCIWIIGIVALLIYSIISYYKVIKNVRYATLVKGNIFKADNINTPFVCGFIKPKIFIPAGINENELSYILKHEQTHIKRLDYIVKPIAFLAVVIHWFNPLMWLSFALMSKDMEMSCDESVIKQMGNDIKGSYSNSLLTLSIKRSGLTVSPLAFGEKNIKSRIKNIISYKKPAVWVVAAGVIITALLMVVLTTNTGDAQVTAPAIYSGFNLENLMKNKTLYVGNNSKVVGLIDSIPLPNGFKRETIELQTSSKPYGLTINLNMKDSSNAMANGVLSSLYNDSVLLFSLIDNVDIIEYKLSDKTGNYDAAAYTFTHTRDNVQEFMGEDVRLYSDNTESLKKLINKLSGMSFYESTSGQGIIGNQIEKQLKVIMSSPMQSSNPYDYINAHKTEYQSIIKIGDVALNYMLDQFETGKNSGLRGYIMMVLCKEILGDRNNVTDASLPPNEWYSKLSIGKD
jgi:beta-lactamase regulating signal transducer with metallopeptidase domain